MAKHIRWAFPCLLFFPFTPLIACVSDVGGYYATEALVYQYIVSGILGSPLYWTNDAAPDTFCVPAGREGYTNTDRATGQKWIYGWNTSSCPGEQYLTGPVPGVCTCPPGETWDGDSCEAAPPPEPCVPPEIGDPGACICPFPYVEDLETGACVSDTCTTEMPYLEAEPGVTPGTVGCFAGCAYTAIMSVDVVDPNTSYSQMRPNGTDCPSVVPEPPPVVGTPDPTQCITDALGNSICIDGNAPTNCGTVNGEYVCIPSMEDNSCVSTPGGSIVCIGSGAPDTGSDGTPENPTPVPAPAFQLTGLPEPASGTTGTDGSDQAPVQIWPVGEGTGAALFAFPGTDTDGDGLDDGGAVATADPEFSPADAEELLDEKDEPLGGPFGSMSWYVPESGTCPAPTSMEVFGQTSYVEWDVACDLMEMIRPFVIALGAMNALFILMHFGR